MPSHRRRSRPAFTLVELLVVIGIIALLISILLAVLGRVREKANAIKCMANLRSLGQGLAIYVTQSRYYPASHAQWEYAIWPTRLRATLGGNQGAFYCPSRPDEYEWTPGIYPATPSPTIGELGFGYYPGELCLRAVPFSYGYNGFGTDTGFSSDWGKRGLGGCVRHRLRPNAEAMTMRELKANHVRVPSDMIAIADSGPFVDHYTGISDVFMIWPLPKAAHHYEFGPPAQVHAGGANVLFCDGHVQWYPAEDLIINEANAIMQHRPLTSHRDQQVARMWNNDHEP
jgi:prepilin-type processing-associated H-X9-DG protein/prepilin-type N-terminal cleavage/methylation domain-containing protein